jgi:glyoxylase-like metal-dependent hydrolase (beta-lactamase superfamily II)
VFYNETSGELITGDLILGWKDGRGYVNRFCWDEDQIRRTFAALADMIRVRIIYPGHGAVIWHDRDAFGKVDCFGEAQPRDDFQKICFDETRNGLCDGRTGKDHLRKLRR